MFNSSIRGRMHGMAKYEYDKYHSLDKNEQFLRSELTTIIWTSTRRKSIWSWIGPAKSALPLGQGFSVHPHGNMGAVGRKALPLEIPDNFYIGSSIDLSKDDHQTWLLAIDFILDIPRWVSLSLVKTRFCNLVRMTIRIPHTRQLFSRFCIRTKF